MSAPPGTSSVPLPRKSKSKSAAGPSTESNLNSVWHVTEASTSSTLANRCSRADDPDGVCCKDLKDEDDRTLIDPDVVRDVVIGLSDGLTVPFALTAGLSSLGTSKIVVLGGVAELIAGAISMGIGGFLASQAERDHFRFLRRHTALRVARSCAGEMEREIHAVLGPLGVPEKTSIAVASDLRNSEPAYASDEDDNQKGVSRRSSNDTLSDAEAGPGLKWSDGVGLTAFLLKFGEGIEDVTLRRCFVSALTIGAGYLLGGLIPLLPYFFIDQAHIALIWSCVITGVVLLIFGAVKAHVTGSGAGFGSYAWGAVSTLCVGGAAAAAAFGIVRALEG